MPLTHHFSRGALRVLQNGAEVLVIHADGRILTRSLTRNRRLHIQEQRSERFIRWLLNLHTEHERLFITDEPIPKLLPETFQVRSVFAFFAGEAARAPVLLTREPLSSLQIRELLRALPPVAAIVNGGAIHIPRSARGLARGL